MKREPDFYLKLFLYTFRLSAFTLGGGYVIVSLMKKLFVEKLNWISEQEMLNFTAIAQSSPGVMAVNTSVLLGYHLAGIPGALVSTLGTVLPPLIIISVISVAYNAFIGSQLIRNILRGMQAGVCAVIIDVVINMSSKIVKDKKILSIILMPVSFIAVAFFDVNVIFVILVCAVIGLASVIIESKKEDGNDPA